MSKEKQRGDEKEKESKVLSTWLRADKHKLRFYNKEDFLFNFGKEGWLYAYQAAEIERNRANSSQLTDRLGTIRNNPSNNKYMQSLIEKTKASQQKDALALSINTTPQQCIKSLQERISETECLFKMCGEIKKKKEDGKLSQEDQNLFVRQQELLNMISQYNDKTEEFTKRFKP